MSNGSTPNPGLEELLRDHKAHKLVPPVVSARMLEAADEIARLTALLSAEQRGREAFAKRMFEAGFAAAADNLQGIPPGKRFTAAHAAAPPEQCPSLPVHTEGTT